MRVKRLRGMALPPGRQTAASAPLPPFVKGMRNKEIQSEDKDELANENRPANRRWPAESSPRRAWQRMGFSTRQGTYFILYTPTRGNAKEFFSFPQRGCRD